MRYLILIISLWAVSTLAMAEDESGFMSEYCEHHDCSVPGPAGINGSDGINGINGSIFNSNQLTQAIAINGAIANIPALSHTGGAHKHTGAGFGVANYANETAVSVGVLHQHENLSYKLTFGFAGNQRIVGSGMSFAF